MNTISQESLFGSVDGYRHAVTDERTVVLVGIYLCFQLPRLREVEIQDTSTFPQRIEIHGDYTRLISYIARGIPILSVDRVDVLNDSEEFVLFKVLFHDLPLVAIIRVQLHLNLKARSCFNA